MIEQIIETFFTQQHVAYRIERVSTYSDEKGYNSKYVMTSSDSRIRSKIHRKLISALAVFSHLYGYPRVFDQHGGTLGLDHRIVAPFDLDGATSFAGGYAFYAVRVRAVGKKHGIPGRRLAQSIREAVNLDGHNSCLVSRSVWIIPVCRKKGVLQENVRCMCVQKCMYLRGQSPFPVYFKRLTSALQPGRVCRRGGH